MEISKLETGMVVKNYKDLCELLEITPTTGNSKLMQLKELGIFVSYHKEGNKIIIDEIYKEVKEKMDARGKSEGSRNNNAVAYIENIKRLILDLLVQNLHKEKACLSKNMLFKELKMINSNYAFCKRRIPKLSTFMDISEDTIEEWYLSTDATLKSNLEKALDGLRKQSLIVWSSEISVCKIDVTSQGSGIYDINKKVTIDECGEEIISFKVKAGHTYNFREASEIEKKAIIFIEREVMKELGFDDKQSIVQANKWDMYKKKVNRIAFKELNINYYFDSYKILFNEEHVYEKYEELEDLALLKGEREELQSQLNNAIEERIYTNVENKQTRALKKTENWIGEIDNSKLKRRVGETYLEDNIKLIGNLINKDAKDITKTIKKLKVVQS